MYIAEVFCVLADLGATAQSLLRWRWPVVHKCTSFGDSCRLHRSVCSVFYGNRCVDESQPAWPGCEWMPRKHSLSGLVSVLDNSSRNYPPATSRLQLLSASIRPVSHSWSVGDSQLTMADHVTTVCRAGLLPAAPTTSGSWRSWRWRYYGSLQVPQWASRSPCSSTRPVIDQNLPYDPAAPLGEVCLYFSGWIFNVLQNAACLPRICCGLREIYRVVGAVVVGQSLMSTVAQTFVLQAYISCRLDYCNSLLYGIADSQLRRLQSAQSAAACLIILLVCGVRSTSLQFWSHFTSCRSGRPATDSV